MDFVRKAMRLFDNSIERRRVSTEVRLMTGNGKHTAEGCLKKGKDGLDRNESDQAILHFNEAIQLDPTSADAHFYRGKVYAEKGSHDEAVADFTRAIEIDSLF